jgi:uncharacterized damage-inducible protein DinB
MGNEDLVAYFDYLCLARDKLFRWVGEQPADLYTRAFPVGLGSVRDTLMHTARSQWAYSRWLDGKEYHTEENPFTAEKLPDFESLSTSWSDANPYTRQVLQDFDRERQIEWTPSLIKPPIRIRITGRILAGQLLFHEVHHRAQVMTMLRQVGVQAENLDYAVLLYETTPV